MRLRETEGAPCFSRGKLDFSPAEKGSLLERLLAAEVLRSGPHTGAHSERGRSAKHNTTKRKDANEKIT